MKNKNELKERLSVSASPAEIKKLRHFAIDKGVSASSVVRDALQNYFGGNEAISGTLRQSKKLGRKKRLEREAINSPPEQNEIEAPGDQPALQAIDVRNFA